MSMSYKYKEIGVDVINRNSFIIDKSELNNIVWCLGRLIILFLEIKCLCFNKGF